MIKKAGGIASIGFFLYEFFIPSASYSMVCISFLIAEPFKYALLEFLISQLLS